jgi:hypothetical protein
VLAPDDVAQLQLLAHSRTLSSGIATDPVVIVPPRR